LWYFLTKFSGALKPAHLERIIIDASHIDQKKRGVLDMKETQVPLVDLLARPELKERFGTAGENGRIEQGKIELLFF
jgi:protein CMS1